MKLSVKALGLATGLLWGLTIFVGTLLAVYADYLVELMNLLVGVYPWYDVSLAGAFIGLGIGFVDGFIGGAVLAWLYNMMVGCCTGKCEKK